MSVCGLCPATRYAPSFGSSFCLVCPGGKISPPGASQLSQCVSPTTNFFLGGAVLAISLYVAGLYLVAGRFRFAAFIRKERVVFQQIRAYHAFMETLKAKDNDMNNLISAREMRDKIAREIRAIMHPTKDGTKLAGRTVQKVALEVLKIIVFMAIALVVCVVATFAIFSLLLMTVFFQALIISRQSSFLGNIRYSAVIQEVVQTILSIFGGLPAVVLDLVDVLLHSALTVFQHLSKLRIDLSGIGVTCAGATAPFVLLVNLSVLGGVIIVILSGLQLFRCIVFRAAMTRYNAHLLSREYRIVGTEPYQEPWEVALWGLWYLAVLLFTSALQLLYYVINFQSFLQFIVSMVQIRTFGASHGWHADTPDCNTVTGYENWDMYLARGTSAVAYLLVLPAVYEVSRVLCPLEPKKDGKDMKYESRKLSSGADGSLGVCTVFDSAGESALPENITLCGDPESSIVGLFSSLPASAWLRLPWTLVAPDLLLAHLAAGVLALLPVARSEQLQQPSEQPGSDAVASSRQSLHLKKRGSFTAEAALTGRARDEAADGACYALKSSAYSFIRDILVTLRAFPRPLTDEADLWRQDEKLVVMPSYLGLLQQELHALTCMNPYFKASEERMGSSKPYPAVGYFLCLLLFLAPVGHLTTVGQVACIKVVQKYVTFVKVCLGVWSDYSYKAYGIAEEVEHNCFSHARNADRRAGDPDRHSDNSSSHSDCLSAVVGPRAILLQIVPFLSIFSVFAIATSGSPLFVHSNTTLYKTIAPAILSPSEAFARAREFEKGHKYEKREWMIIVRGVSMLLLESRLLQFLVSAFMVFVSIYILAVGVDRAIIFAAVCILLPMAFAHALKLVVVVGKALNVKDLWKVLCDVSIFNCKKSSLKSQSFSDWVKAKVELDRAASRTEAIIALQSGGGDEESARLVDAYAELIRLEHAKESMSRITRTSQDFGVELGAAGATSRGSRLGSTVQTPLRDSIPAMNNPLLRASLTDNPYRGSVAETGRQSEDSTDHYAPGRPVASSGHAGRVSVAEFAGSQRSGGANGDALSRHWHGQGQGQGHHLRDQRLGQQYVQQAAHAAPDIPNRTHSPDLNLGAIPAVRVGAGSFPGLSGGDPLPVPSAPPRTQKSNPSFSPNPNPSRGGTETVDTRRL